MAPVPAGTSAVVGLLETTDVHSNVVGYDYFRLAPDASLGLERTAALIAAGAPQYPNNLLIDNGDTIQGTALADYQALVKPLACDQTLAVYKAMNHLGFDGGGIGNHEFNYGLAYLSQVTGNRFDVAGVDPKKPRCAGPAFPQVLANVYSVKTKQPLFAPYRIIDKQISGHRRRRQAADGHAQGGHHRLHAADHHGLGQALARRQGLHRRPARERRTSSFPRCAPRAPTWWSRSRTAGSMTAPTRRPWKTATSTWPRCRASTRC